MIGIAVVGAGRWGPHLIRNFHEHQASDVLWVVDRSAHRLREVGRRFPGASLARDLESALADDQVQAVVVATPAATHFAIVEAALEANKHVLVEKPITTSVTSAERLCELARSRQRVLMVGHVFLFNPAVRAAKSYLEAGHLGDIYYVSMTRTNLGPVRFDVNVTWDLAAHDVSIANHWLDGIPVTVSATAGSWLNPGLDDAVFATLRYPDGVVVHIEASWLSPRKTRDIVVVGERAMLTVNDMDPQEPLRLYDKQVVEAPEQFTDTLADFRASVHEGTISIPHVAVGEPLRAECDAFLTQIQGSPSSVSDGWKGLGVVQTLAAIDRSVGDGGRQILVEATPVYDRAAS